MRSARPAAHPASARQAPKLVRPAYFGQGGRRRNRVSTGGAALIAGKAASHRSGAQAQRAAEGTGAIQTVDMQEDVTLVRRTLAGDQQAFANLVEKYKDSVF